MTQSERVNQAPVSAGDAVAAQVRRYRLRRDLSVRQLAEECAALGAPQLTAASLGNIERGQDQDAKRKRRDVTVDELMVLARALGVPPLLLMVPLDSQPAIELVPGEVWGIWDAVRWVTGEAHPEGEIETFFAIPLQLNRELQRVRDRYVMLMADDIFAPKDEREREERRAEMGQLEYQVLALRADMERHGMPLPPLGPEFEHLAGKRHAYLAPETAEQFAARGALRRPDPRGPGRGQPIKPGEPTRDAAALDQGRRFVEQWHRDHPDE